MSSSKKCPICGGPVSVFSEVVWTEWQCKDDGCRHVEFLDDAGVEDQEEESDGWDDAEDRFDESDYDD